MCVSVDRESKFCMQSSEVEVLEQRAGVQIQHGESNECVIGFLCFVILYQMKGIVYLHCVLQFNYCFQFLFHVRKLTNRIPHDQIIVSNLDPSTIGPTSGIRANFYSRQRGFESDYVIAILDLQTISFKTDIANQRSRFLTVSITIGDREQIANSDRAN